jgi:predicted DNA-binding transcriptional regulator AlpA
MASEQGHEQTADIDGDDLLDVDAACSYLGGTKRLSRATLYRMVKSGQVAPPVKIAPNITRFIKSSLRETKLRCIAQRDVRAA